MVLLAVNLALVTRTMHDGNEELAQYTAGLDAAGSGHRLFVMQADPSPTPLVNPLSIWFLLTVPFELYGTRISR